MEEPEAHLIRTVINMPLMTSLHHLSSGGKLHRKSEVLHLSKKL